MWWTIYWILYACFITYMIRSIWKTIQSTKKIKAEIRQIQIETMQYFPYLDPEEVLEIKREAAARGMPFPDESELEESEE